jgi:hypothetical protein
MFWSEQPEDIVIVLTHGEDPTWYEFKAWSFVPGSSICASEFTPGPGRFSSVHAFGGVWCDNPHIRQSLGFATAPERGVGGAIQEFEDGFVLRNDDPSQVYVLFRDDETYVREGASP